jgi:hypothetical protein
MDQIDAGLWRWIGGRNRRGEEEAEEEEKMSEPKCAKR